MQSESNPPSTQQSNPPSDPTITSPGRNVAFKYSRDGLTTKK